MDLALPHLVDEVEVVVEAVLADLPLDAAPAEVHPHPAESLAREEVHLLLRGPGEVDVHAEAGGEGQADVEGRGPVAGGDDGEDDRGKCHG